MGQLRRDECTRPLYFCTGADERKARNLETNRRAALVFEVAPSVAFGFGRGEYSQTRWRFGQE